MKSHLFKPSSAHPLLPLESWQESQDEVSEPPWNTSWWWAVGGEDEVGSHTHVRCSAETGAGSAPPQSLSRSIASGDKKTSWRKEVDVDILQNVSLREESSEGRKPAFGSCWSADSHLWASWIYPILGAGDLSLPQSSPQPVHSILDPLMASEKEFLHGVGLRTTDSPHSPRLCRISEGDFHKHLSSVAVFSLQAIR